MFISFARTKETNQRKVRHERRIGFLQCFPQPDPIKGQQKPQFRTVRGRRPSVLISLTYEISFISTFSLKKLFLQSDHQESIIHHQTSILSGIRHPASWIISLLQQISYLKSTINYQTSILHQESGIRHHPTSIINNLKSNHSKETNQRKVRHELST